MFHGERPQDEEAMTGFTECNFLGDRPSARIEIFPTICSAPEKSDRSGVNQRRETAKHSSGIGHSPHRDRVEGFGALEILDSQFMGRSRDPELSERPGEEAPTFPARFDEVEPFDPPRERQRNCGNPSSRAEVEKPLGAVMRANR